VSDPICLPMNKTYLKCSVQQQQQQPRLIPNVVWDDKIHWHFLIIDPSSKAILQAILRASINTLLSDSKRCLHPLAGMIAKTDAYTHFMVTRKWCKINVCILSSLLDALSKLLWLQLAGWEHAVTIFNGDESSWKLGVCLLQ
jgi:hypothetical protein